MRLFQNICQPGLVEGYRFECQYFDKPASPSGRLNMTIKTTFETAPAMGDLQSRIYILSPVAMLKVNSSPRLIPVIIQNHPLFIGFKDLFVDLLVKKTGQFRYCYPGKLLYFHTRNRFDDILPLLPGVHQCNR
jgi:hypothetical protein